MIAFAHISSTNSGKRILIAAGGTGGHVYPAISIADALKAAEPDANLLFVGTGTNMESTAVPKAGYPFRPIWISGFHRRITIQNLLFPVKLMVSLLQSLKIIMSFKPDVVIACGGYASGPVAWVAAKLSKPLFLQEQNSYPGVTNRLLGKSAEKIFTAFDEAAPYFPSEKVENVGNPIRAELTAANQSEALDEFNFSDDKPVLLVLGGSGGAKSINQAMAEHVKKLHDELGLQIIWQCGNKYYEEYNNRIDSSKLPDLRLRAFLHNMAFAYAAADLVISRAGALSCSELQITGNACLLVPSPHVAADHQTKNAQSMADRGAAKIITDDSLNEQLVDEVSALIQNQQKLETMQQEARKMGRPDAAQNIAEQILSHINTT